MWSYNNYYEKLYHHGILGMKWGVRKGPPYPLLPEKHSASENKSGWRKSLGGGRNEHLYERNDKKSRKKLTKEQKTKLAMGAAITTTAALAIIGSVSLYKSGNLDDLIAVGGETIRKLGLRGNIQKIHIADEFELKHFSFHDIVPSMEQAANNSNPARDVSKLKFQMLSDFDKVPLQNVNCEATTFANELQRRGIDAHAQLIDTRSEDWPDVLDKLFDYTGKARVQQVFSSPKDLEKHILKMGEGARGSVGLRDWSGGHNVSFEVSGGKVYAIDSQLGKVLPFNQVTDFLPSAYQFEAYRLDDLPLNSNNLEFIKKFVTGVLD